MLSPLSVCLHSTILVSHLQSSVPYCASVSPLPHHQMFLRFFIKKMALLPLMPMTNKPKGLVEHVPISLWHSPTHHLTVSHFRQPNLGDPNKGF